MLVKELKPVAILLIESRYVSRFKVHHTLVHISKLLCRLVIIYKFNILKPFHCCLVPGASALS